MNSWHKLIGRFQGLDATTCTWHTSITNKAIKNNIIAKNLKCTKSVKQKTSTFYGLPPLVLAGLDLQSAFRTK